MSRSAGFSLIEVLVALVITGVLIGLIVLSLPSSTAADHQREDLQRFYALANQHCREAVLLGRQHGIRLTEQGYEFRRYAAGGWQPMPSNAVFRPRRWQRPWDWSLQIQNLPVEPDDESPVHLICAASGEWLPFEMVLRHGRDRASLRVAGNGERW